MLDRMDEASASTTAKGAADGFAISVTDSGRDLAVAPGRMYVDGLLVENGADGTTLRHQPHVGDALGAGPMKGDLPVGSYAVYLDVWERSVTAVEDESIREIALAGPDTSARTEVLWQVNLARVAGADEPSPTCESVGDGWRPTHARSGKLAARAELVVEAPDGFHDVESQLYRVEIHSPGSYGSATFKWSVDNGSEAAMAAIPDAEWIPIEGGVEVRFTDGEFRAGDYWKIAARTTAMPGRRVIDWPIGTDGRPLERSPVAVAHHYAKLGIVTFDGAAFTVQSDCRGSDCGSSR
jgi:hypothetical protein